jgi:multicomponent Na+:H+ antiporter subunit G
MRTTSGPSDDQRHSWQAASTPGLGCLLAAVALRNPELSFVIRAASIAAFMLLTTAVSAHVIARAAALTGAPLWKGTIVDERAPKTAKQHDHDTPGRPEAG